MKIGRIVVSLSGDTSWSMCGESKSMIAQYDALVEALKAPDGTGDKWFELTGFREHVDRGFDQMTIRLEDVRAVDIQVYND